MEARTQNYQKALRRKVLSDKVHVGEMTEKYDTEDGIVGAVTSHLSD